METVISTTISGQRKRRWLLAAIVATAGVVGLGLYLWWPRSPVVPQVATDGFDPEIAAAIQKARAAIEREPKSAGTWGRLGMQLFAQDMYAECIPILVEAERLAPAESRWPYFRGLALLLNDPDEGIAALEMATRLPNCPFSVRLRLAEEYWKLQRIDQADAMFHALLIEEPDHPRVLLGCGQVRSRQGHFAEAVDLLKRAAQDPTARQSARITLAETLGRMGKAMAAEAERSLAARAPPDQPWHDPYLAEAQQLRTGLQPRIDRAVELSNNGRLPEASAIMAQVLIDHPDSDEAHLAMAKVLIQASRIEDAQQELQRALELNADLVEGHVLLGGVRTQRQDFRGAEAAYKRAVELKPDYGYAYFLMGECRLKQGRNDEAIQSYREALRYRPDLGAAHLKLGELLLEEKRFDDAIRSLENAVRLDGGNDRTRSLLERARRRKGP
jgi:tetratricopeptide (TPR) repeat protein